MSTKFAPPAGRIVHAIGQFESGNQAWLNAIAPLGISTPCFRTQFTSIGAAPWQPSLSAYRLALAKYAKWMTDGHLRSMSPHLALDLRTTTVDAKKTSTVLDINAGAYDAWIEALADTVHDYHFPILLRIGVEVTSPHERRLKDGSLITGDAFAEAYRRIVGILEARGARANAALCWNIEVGSGDPDFESFWPGADVVDFGGVDFFHGSEFGAAMTPAREQADAFASFMRSTRRPLWVMESSCIDARIGTTAQEAEAAWDQWFSPLLTWMQDNDVAGWHYINEAWAGNPNGWLSGRVDGNPFLCAMLREEFARPKWLHAPGQILLSGAKEVVQQAVAAIALPGAPAGSLP